MTVDSIWTFIVIFPSIGDYTSVKLKNRYPVSLKSKNFHNRRFYKDRGLVMEVWGAYGNIEGKFVI